MIADVAIIFAYGTVMNIMVSIRNVFMATPLLSISSLYLAIVALPILEIMTLFRLIHFQSLHSRDDGLWF